MQDSPRVIEHHVLVELSRCLSQWKGTISLVSSPFTPKRARIYGVQTELELEDHGNVSGVA